MKAKLEMYKESNPVLMTETKYKLDKVLDKLYEDISLKKAIEVEWSFKDKLNKE